MFSFLLSPPQSSLLTGKAGFRIPLRLLASLCMASPALLTPSMLKPSERDCVTGTMLLLEDYRAAVGRSDFEEAERLEQEIREAKEEQLRMLQDRERSRQAFEAGCLDRACGLVLKEEEQRWRDAEEKLKEEIEEEINRLREDHAVELERFEDECARRRPPPRACAEVLQLRKQSETLFRLKQFEEAKKAARLAEEAELRFNREQSAALGELIERDRARMAARHQREFEILEKKNYSRFCRFYTEREAALASSARRVTNLHADMAAAHALEYINMRTHCVDRDIVKSRQSYSQTSSTFLGSRLLNAVNSSTANAADSTTAATRGEGTSAGAFQAGKQARGGGAASTSGYLPTSRRPRSARSAQRAITAAATKAVSGTSRTSRAARGARETVVSQ